MEKILKHLASLDWFVAAATLGYGLVTWNWVIALVGVAGLFLAWYGPAQRIKKLLEKKLLVKAAKPSTTAQAVESELFYAEKPGSVPEADVAPSEPPRPTPGYHARVSTQMHGAWQVSPSKHNHFKASLLNLYNSPAVATPVTNKAPSNTVTSIQPERVLNNASSYVP